MLCPLDSRYKKKVEPIADVFAPEQLTGNRLFIIEKWLQYIAQHFKPEFKDKFKPIVYEVDYFQHLTIEKLEFEVTRHDINACIKYLEIKYSSQPELLPYIHFGLTSNDVNSVAYALILERGKSAIYLSIEYLIDKIKDFANNNDYPMLSYTHGQPATPTTFCFAMQVFVERLQQQIKLLNDHEIKCKFGGATGGLNTLYLIDPDVDWRAKLDTFIDDISGFKCSHYTTQIDHYDDYAQLFDILKRISVILINFVQDIWLYISKTYIVQKPVAGEVGSSTMPHKINPIQMENAKGNLLLAKALFTTLSEELPISTLQRDLHDSTMLRNIGMPFGYLYLAIISIKEGLDRYHPSKENMAADLNQHWEILGEAVQTVLRSEGHVNAYDLIKIETRNNENINQSNYIKLLTKLYDNNHLSKNGLDKLTKLTPATYLPGMF